MRAALTRLADGVDALGRAAGWLAAAALVLIVLLVVAEVASRDLLGRSLNFTWEIAGYLMGAVFLLGAAHTLAEGAHVRSGLQDLVPSAALRRVLEVACHALGLFVAAYATWALSALATTSWTRGVTSWSSAAVPLWIPQGTLALGAALLALQFAAGLLRLLLGAEAGRSAEALAAAQGEAL